MSEELASGEALKRARRLRIPSSRRLLVGAALAVGVAWLAVAALRSPSLPAFEASGPPLSQPPAGAFPSVSPEEFEGILVGLRGRPVVVNVWASWCAPCRTEMPLLQRAADTYAQRAVILGVASNDDIESAKAFLDELGITYPNVFDPTGRIRVTLGLTAYPTTYLFGADGKIRARVDGGVSEQQLTALIDDALP